MPPSPASLNLPRQARTPRRQHLALALSALLLLIASLGVWRWQTAAFPVTLTIDGQSATVKTHARTPAALLRSLGYPLRPEDDLTVRGAWGPRARIQVRRARPVQVLADGQSQTVWTTADDVAGVLNDAMLALSPADEILLGDRQVTAADALPPAHWLPPAGRRSSPPWQQMPQPLTLSILRANPIQVIEEGGVARTLWTRAQTVAGALTENDIPVQTGDELLPGPDTAIQPNMRVLIRRAAPITIIADGHTIATRTRAKTVAAALREAGILLMAADQVHPPLDAALHPHTAIIITRITEKVVYEDELLPFETIWQPDDDLLIDTRRVGTEGRPGVMRRRYRIRYENGQEVARDLEDEWQAVAPERKVILYGRKIVQRTAMTPDGPITYWRKLRAYTTSYSPKRSGTDPSLPWYGHTRLGFTAGKGVVGVDPSVINMSQKLYVPGYGFAIAGDTGSGLHGKHLDLGFSDDNYESWHWWSDVYLLWPPPPSYAINYLLPNWPRYKGSRNPYAGLVTEK